jgi:hypothetical protein
MRTRAGSSRTSLLARATWLAAACLLFAGCTRVAFRTPLGKPAAASDLNELVGQWKGEKGMVWTVEREAASGRLRASWAEDGKPRTETLVLTTLGTDNAVHIVWAEETDLSAFVPLRISAAEDALALLYPSDGAVKALVDKGKLAGTFNKEKNAWIISEGDWTGLLERPDFWTIDMCLPFVRIDRPRKAEAPPAPPAAPEPPHS